MTAVIAAIQTESIPVIAGFVGILNPVTTLSPRAVHTTRCSGILAVLRSLVACLTGINPAVAAEEGVEAAVIIAGVQEGGVVKSRFALLSQSTLKDPVTAGAVLQLAKGGAAIGVVAVGIVALFIGIEGAVAAEGEIARGLAAAGGSTTVVGNAVAVVALLAEIQDTVAAVGKSEEGGVIIIIVVTGVVGVIIIVVTGVIVIIVVIVVTGIVVIIIVVTGVVVIIVVIVVTGVVVIIVVIVVVTTTSWGEGQDFYVVAKCIEAAISRADVAIVAVLVNGAFDVVIIVIVTGVVVIIVVIIVTGIVVIIVVIVTGVVVIIVVIVTGIVIVAHINGKLAATESFLLSLLLLRNQLRKEVGHLREEPLGELPESLPKTGLR